MVWSFVPIWNTRPFRERKEKKRSTGAASVELTVMTAFAGSPEPEASIARRGGLLSRPKRRHTAECVARVWKCRERGPRRRRWSRGATRSRRRARSRTTRYARERCRGRRGPARRAPPPPPVRESFRSDAPARTLGLGHPALTPHPLANARRSSATRSRNPCRRAMSCRTGACARFCPSSWRQRRRRCVPARSFDPLRERHGAVNRDPLASRDRARLGSATRDENVASGVFPEPRARRNARRPRDEAMKRPRTS